MIQFSTYGKIYEDLNWELVDKKASSVARTIEEKTGAGNDFLGWLDYASKLDEKEIVKIEEAAKEIREKFDTLVVIGIGGSYLGARAAIEAIRGLYPRKDDLEIIFLGNTLSSEYTKQVLDHLEGKRFAINVISKSGTTTEPAVAFRILKEMMLKKFGKEYLKDAIFVTTDRAKGALKTEADATGYKTFVIPDDIGGRFSVMTPVGLLPIAAAGINIREFLQGIKDGQKDYSDKDYHNNLAYKYAAIRYLLHVEKKFPAEMFIAYEPQNAMINEWLKQLFDESEGKEDKALLCASAVFTTDLHSIGQFIQQGSPVLFETIIRAKEPIENIKVPYDEKDLDNLNYLAGKDLNYINEQAFKGTLKAHAINGHTPVNLIEIEKMDAYNLGNLFYFFFRATAFSAYLLEVNPFNQPGVEIYKSNMFELLGKPKKK